MKYPHPNKHIMNDRNGRARSRAIQRLLTRKAELRYIGKWTKEANAWYDEGIWGDDEGLRQGAKKCRRIQ